MTPRIPGYHIPQPLPPPQPILPPLNHWEKPIVMPEIKPYIDPNISVSQMAKAWEPKPTHPDYPYLPYYISPDK